jgi:gamma-glutamylcyclotransferase
MVPSPSTFQYFAYGSNMLTRRLAAPDRAPSAKRVGIGHVEGRRLNFCKVSKDGSGKCDAAATGRKMDRVHGVIFEIAVADKTALARAEGSGNGYIEERVNVITASGDLELLTYIATEKNLLLRPYHWYRAMTVTGAVEHGLPNGYVEWLRTFESIEDVDVLRRATNEALLFAD